MIEHRQSDVLRLVEAAAHLPADERAVFLADACGSDGALRAEVDALLVHAAAPWPALDERRIGTFSAAPSGDAPAMPAELPEQFGRYRILGRLGRGAAGVVYRAEQSFPRREVALKVLAGALPATGMPRRFRREAATLARLEHPGIVQIFDAGVERTPVGDQPFIAMELVRGENLLVYCNTRGLNTAERLRLVAAICDAVEYAHRNGVVHRDLKPQNILVEERGGVPRPRILDFGIARLTEGEQADMTQTLERGHLLGTLAYMSPEQASGNAEPRSDVYSIGCVAYELLCGELPVDTRGLPVLGALARLREARPIALGRRDRRLRGDVETIVAKAIEREPEQRYASAAALAADIRRHLEAEPISIRPRGLLYSLGKLAQRHRVAAMWAGGVLAALFVGLIGTTYGLLASRRSQAALEAQLEQAAVSSRFIASEVVKNLDPLVGTSQVRAKLLEHFQVQAEHLLTLHPQDAMLLDTYATILGHRGSLERDAGRPAAALVLRQRAVTIRQGLVERDPGNVELRRRLAVNLVQVGDIAKEAGQYAGARPCYESALAMQQVAAADTPGDLGVQEDLAWSFARLANLALLEYRFEDAAALLAQCERTIAGLEANGGPERSVLECRDTVAAVRAALAWSRLDEESFYSVMIGRLPTLRRLIQIEPNDRRWLTALVNVLLNVIDHAPLDPSRPLQGCDVCEELDAVCARLARLEPDDPEVLKLLGRCKLSLADRLARAGRYDDALRVGLEGVNRWRLGTHYSRQWAGLARWLVRLSAIARSAGDTGLALELRLEAVELQQRICGEDSAQPPDFFELAVVLSTTDSAAECTHLPGALLAIEEAIRRSGGNVSQYWGLRGRLCEATGDWFAAIESYEQALNLLNDSQFEQCSDLQRRLVAARGAATTSPQHSGEE